MWLWQQLAWQLQSELREATSQSSKEEATSQSTALSLTFCVTADCRRQQWQLRGDPHAATRWANGERMKTQKLVYKPPAEMIG